MNEDEYTINGKDKWSRFATGKYNSKFSLKVLPERKHNCRLEGGSSGSISKRHEERRARRKRNK